MEATRTIWSGKVPDEILLRVFNYCSVDFKLLLRIAAVCHEWRRVVGEDSLWTAHLERCLHMRIHRKTWYEKVVCLKERGQLNIRELIIDKSKSIFVLFNDTKTSLYHLSRQGEFKLHHQFDKCVTSSEAASFLGGKFNYSTTSLFRSTKYTTPGDWKRCGREDRYTPTTHQNYVQILDVNNDVSEELPLLINPLTGIDRVSRIEKFGKFILTCGLDGSYVGDGFSNNITSNVVWKIKESKSEIFYNHHHGLEPVLQLSLSDQAILIDGMFIDIVDQKKIKMVNLVENPLIHKPGSSTCVIL